MYEEHTRKLSRKSLKGLDYLNLFLADVRDGVELYLAIYLKASHNWNPANIGIAMSAVMAVASVIAVSKIREREIDHELARGAGEEDTSEHHKASGLFQILRDRRILIFAVAVVLFHFANAAMLPLVGQQLSEGKATGASLYMSACIIVAQLVMIPVSTFAGRFANTRRKPILLAAFAVLPIRGVLYTLNNNP